MTDRGEQAAELFFCKKHQGLRVLDHERQPFGRVGWVHRHVGATCFPRSQQSNNHVRRALQADAHENVGPNAAAAKEAGQSVRALIQLLVGNLAPLENHSNGMRIASHLLFEKFVRTNLRECHSGVIPFAQKAIMFVQLFCASNENVIRYCHKDQATTSFITSFEPA